MTDTSLWSELESLSEQELIERMAAVMAISISKLIQPCIEQRCKQFLTLIHEKGIKE